MSAAFFACESIDRDWLDGLIIRWKTADDLVDRLYTREGAQIGALRRILRRDVPALIKELTRLRPELGTSEP